MDATHDQRLMDLVAAARGCPAGEREAFLRARCEDSALCDEVSEMLAWDERMGDFLQKPMVSYLDIARPFVSGQVVADRFEIAREIGEGGMGVVYEAFDRRRKQKIAIKAAKLGFQSLLSPELEGALKVRHPNICLVNEIHSVHTGRGAVDFLTMEYLEGETLAAHLSKQGAPEREAAADIARQLCAGLAEAHRSGIIHRDLKPANIMLCPAGGGTRVVITDFGLAGGDTPDSADIAGTPAYMAPELSHGARTSMASDVYALGVILHELFVGVKPPRNHPPGKSGSARRDRAIRRCLQADPRMRFADANEVRRALEPALRRKERLLIAGLAATVVLTVVSQQSTVHGWLEDHFWPPTANVRLAVMPLAAAGNDTAEMNGILQDVSDRLAKMRSAGRTVIVITPRDTQRDHVTTIEEAGTILHATHALQTRVHREGDDLVMSASLIDLETHVNVGEAEGRYSAATIANMPSALAGSVSLALRLKGGNAAQALLPAAVPPYDRGLYFLRDAQDAAKAIDSFREAARLDARSVLPLAALIQAQIAQFQVTKDAVHIYDAQQTLKLAQSIDPDSIDVLLAGGRLAETSGNYEQARENYQRVHELDARNVDAYLRMASVDDALNYPDRAIDSYRKAIELEPGYFKPYHHLGVFYYYRGKYPEAAEQFQKAIDRAPGRIDAYVDLAAAWSDFGEDEKAEKALRASLRIRETAGAWNSLGAIRAYQKNDAEAVEHFRRAAELAPASYINWLNVADASRRLGLAAESTAAYGKAMALAKSELAQNPRLGLPRAYVAYFSARLGNRDAAVDDIGEAMKFSPGDSKVMRRAVLTYEALGMHAETFRVLDSANPELTRELARHPDLTSLAADPRFQQLASHTPSKGP
jgi:serine/threonine protein kinase/tetratricopeptide (TPR) repeat protein